MLRRFGPATTCDSHSSSWWTRRRHASRASRASPLPAPLTHPLPLAQEREAAWELGVTATPALLCYWEGTPVTVHRSDWEGGFAFVGAISRPQLVEYLRHTRDCCVDCSEKGRPLVTGIEF